MFIVTASARHKLRRSGMCWDFIATRFDGKNIPRLRRWNLRRQTYY